MPRLDNGPESYRDFPSRTAAASSSGGRSSARNRLNAFIQDKITTANGMVQSFLDWYRDQSLARKILLQLALLAEVVFVILVLIYHNDFIHLLDQLSDNWHKLKYGQLILFTLVFFVGFPPLIGFSALSTLTGMVYGFPNGWPLLASASIIGSLVSFLVNRYWLHSYAVRLINTNETFRAFSEILKEENSLFLLVLLRLCPLPYSLSNGALAAIPELPVSTYTLASIITSPKLLIHIFVGYKLKNISNDKTSVSSKVVDFLSIFVTGLAFLLATYFIYNKMQQKLASYHRNATNPVNSENYDRMIFGNFEDDLELGSQESVELNSADFDADNFIIEDEDEDDDGGIRQSSEPLAKSDSTKKSSPEPRTFTIDDDNLDSDFDRDVTVLSASSNNRNY